MTKRFLAFVVIFVFLLFFYRIAIGNYVVSVFNETKSYYISIVDDIENSFFKYFNQSDHIEKLLIDNKNLKQNNILLDTYKNELHKYQNKFHDNSLIPNLEMIKALSYVSLGDMNKFWMSIPKTINLNKNKIYGLIYKNSAAGIAKLDGINLKAFLNFDEKCVYAVEIGKNNIPGIIFGNGKNMQIKFIPSWLKPKIGDEVKTSGLDDIFESGIKVGVIQKINQNDVYKSAIVKVGNRISIPSFLYILK